MLLLQEYRDYDSLINDISHKKNNKVMECEHSSDKEDYDFTKTKTYREAVRMFKAGFPEVIPKMKTGVEQQKKINSKLFADVKSPRPINFFVGYIPNVPNSIQNLPNSMIFTDRKPMKRKTLSIMYSMHGAWFQTTDWFIITLKIPANVLLCDYSVTSSGKLNRVNIKLSHLLFEPCFKQT